jgi:hypothetical protein
LLLLSSKLTSQVVKDAADSLEAGDDYTGKDATDRTRDSRKTPQQRPKATPFQKEIYDQAIIYIIALFAEPLNENF